MITVDINDDAVDAALNPLSAQLADMTPVMQSIADFMVRSTKQRCADGDSPEGSKWAAKSPVTLAKYNGKYIRPLFGPNDNLNNRVLPNHGPDFAEVGSNRGNAAIMQFGRTKASFPQLW